MVASSAGDSLVDDRPAGFPEVHGCVSHGYEAVREAFVENFVRRRELGGACRVYRYGEKIVGLWGAVRNTRTGEPWEQDTIVRTFTGPS